MKRSLALAIAMSFGALYAQDNTTTTTNTNIQNEFKPSAGNVSLEVQFEPFGDDPININGIRGRIFSSQRQAFRMNVFIGYDSDTDITQQEVPDANLLELEDRTSTFTLNLRPGMEWHTKGTERLSPYFGFEVDFAIQWSRFRSENQEDLSVFYRTRINENGFTRYGLNAIAGFDYYFAKRIFVGTEMGFGASVTRLRDVTEDSDVPGFVEPEPLNRGGSFELGPNVNVDIRLGYVF
ncbi:MAG: hypothetical protein MJA30_01395 [Cytophagales bacterium]|nr:hypothetical protein [Cytophagales bacterium]